MKELTDTMRRAIKFAQQHENYLVRYPGGEWMQGTSMRVGPPRKFGATTVQALVDRGIMTYTVWKAGKRGQFPIEAMLLGKWRGKDDGNAERI